MMSLHVVFIMYTGSHKALLLQTKSNGTGKKTTKHSYIAPLVLLYMPRFSVVKTPDTFFFHAQIY